MFYKCQAFFHKKRNFFILPATARASPQKTVVARSEFSWYHEAKGVELFGVFSGKDRHYVYPNGDEVSNVDIVYVCRKYTGTLRCQPGEVEQLRFFALDEIPQNISPPIRKPLEEWVASKRR